MRPMEEKLLGAIAVCSPRPVSTDSLAEALWTNPPRSARKTIQTLVVRIRSKLGPSVIETVDRSYRLGRGVEVDLELFERAVERARARSAAETASWDDALALCDDASMHEFDHWSPAEPVRARVAELWSSAVEARWAAALDECSPEDVIPSLEALVSSEPLREQRWTLLLRAYKKAGRDSDGLRAFERARRTLALEIGVSPGLELVRAYEDLLQEEVDPAGVDPTPASRSALVTLSERLRAQAREADRRGNRREAVRLFVAAADAAREAGDPRRFAEAALGAAGDSWITSLDATHEVVGLLAEAVEVVPTGPTPLRCRLLARYAISGEHHLPTAVCGRLALAALAIGRAVDDPTSLAHALHSVSYVTTDPTRRDHRWAWLRELEAQAERLGGGLEQRWTMVHRARLLMLDGDIPNACAALDALEVDSVLAADLGGMQIASHVGVLRATVAGDWTAACRAADSVKSAADAAASDPAGNAVARSGMLGIIELLSGPTVVPNLPATEWPVPSMELSVRAWHADMLATAGREHARDALDAIDPAGVADLDRDGYWLPTLSMLADAAYRVRCPTISAVVLERLEPVLDLTVFDPGMIYRGAVAHSAGLAAATLGRRDRAVELLREARGRHEQHGSTWMVGRTQQALAQVTAT
jgi:DNA-binding SARP family transcriptional activator